LVPVLYATTVFLSAALTFTVQPLVGKQLLPLVGGTPGVWNTCLVFFQAVLLGGYLLADSVTRIRHQLLIQTALLTGAAAVLYLGGLLQPNETLLPADSQSPVVSVFLVLLVAVGLPFLVLSMTAPLLQKWYTQFGRNPYPLYSASNLGSFAGLLGYPLLLEPLLTVSEQRFAWAIGFVVCAGLIAACGYLHFRRERADRGAVQTESGTLSPLQAGQASSVLTAKLVLTWVVLAALPSSLLLSVSTHLTTDIAPVPLLWVLPLALYLLSFVIAFGFWTPTFRRLVGRFVPMLLCFLTVTILLNAAQPVGIVATIHLLAFFGVAVLCHGELAARKPTPEHLTRFYLVLSVGGVLGGLVNTFLAPVLFAKLGTLEYPIAILFAAFVRPPGSTPKMPRWQRSDWFGPLIVGGLTAVFVFGTERLLGELKTDNPADELIDRTIRGGLMFGIPIVLSFALVKRAARFAFCLAAVFVVGSFATTKLGTVLETSRNFFGTLRVTRSADGQFTRLVHGTTIHGQQRSGASGRPDPATYYHRKGPLGNLFELLPRDQRTNVGVIGLGAGAAAAYANAGEHWTFYEIDPAVVRLANDTRYFTFLSTCPAETSLKLGDARRQLQTAPNGTFDLLILDAFSSDAVPVHLLTQEAFELYFSRLGQRGILAFHVSNNYLDLAPLVARVALKVEPTAIVKWQNDTNLSDADKADGKLPSVWVVIARHESDSPKRTDGSPDMRWSRLQPKPGPIWTDDYSNLLGVWKWDEH
jgi:hypothetical protein